MSNQASFFVYSSQVLLATPPLRPAALEIRDGKICSIVDSPSLTSLSVLGCVHDFSPLVLMPGLIDTHVHCNEPGRTDWEGLETATRAAAAGGVTTIVDMPLNSIPPTTTVEGFRAKQAAAKGKCTVDLGLWGGIIPSNLNDLAPLAEAGVLGWKCFLIESGVDEFPCVSSDQLEAAMRVIRQSNPHLPVLVHAEQCSSHGHNEQQQQQQQQHDDQQLYATYLASRPTTLEEDAIATCINLCRKTGAKTHVVHLSACTALPAIESALSEGLNLSIETCPHYLTLEAEHIPRCATHFKCAPPIRDSANRARLWQGLRAGHIRMIVSDHSPCEPSLKHKEFDKSWGGISSLQLALPLIYTELKRQAQEHGAAFNLSDILYQIHQWMCVRTSEFANLNDVKGSFVVGHDADFVVWDPERSFSITPSSLHFKHKVSPYIGSVVYGEVQSTWLRGHKVFDKQQTKWETPIGKQVFAKQWRDTHKQ